MTYRTNRLSPFYCKGPRRLTVNTNDSLVKSYCMTFLIQTNQPLTDMAKEQTLVFPTVSVAVYVTRLIDSTVKLSPGFIEASNVKSG